MRINHQSSTKDKAKLAIKLDSMMQALQDATPMQINNWVDNNVNNLADVKKIIKVLLIHLQMNE